MDEVHRSVKQGFQLDGLSIKGFVNSLVSAFPEKPSEIYKIEFKDGAIQNFDNVEDIILLPNVGKREIKSLNIGINMGSSIGLHSLSMKISNVEDKIVYDISSPDQNWNRSIQSECDDFLSSIRRVLWSDVASKSSFIFMFLPFFIMYLWATFIYSHDDSARNLQVLKLALENKNLSSGEALYKYAEWQSISKRDTAPSALFLLMLLPLVSLIFTRGSIIEMIFKSKIFYMGGMVNIVNQRRAMHALIWVSVVLSIVIGLGVNWLSAKFFAN